MKLKLNSISFTDLFDELTVVSSGQKEVRQKKNGLYCVLSVEIIEVMKNHYVIETEDDDFISEQSSSFLKDTSSIHTCFPHSGFVPIEKPKNQKIRWDNYYVNPLSIKPEIIKDLEERGFRINKSEESIKIEGIYESIAFILPLILTLNAIPVYVYDYYDLLHRQTKENTLIIRNKDNYRIGCCLVYDYELFNFVVDKENNILSVRDAVFKANDFVLDKLEEIKNFEIYHRSSNNR